jgi:nitroimidazol reductase NimA-like FMN-containing flavoprotein (pyridoxamine 5'-phosphate oxidase superfamily)
MINRLDARAALELIGEGRLGRLGCVLDDGPYVVPVNYVSDEQFIYIHSLPGTKIEALRANPRACLQVDEIKNAFEWRSAIVFGTYEEITDAEERDRALQQILNRFPQFTPVETAMSQVQGLPETIIFRLRIEKVTGVTEG